MSAQGQVVIVETPGRERDLLVVIHVGCKDCPVRTLVFALHHAAEVLDVLTQLLETPPAEVH